jgi:hypothetical protein
MAEFDDFNFDTSSDEGEFEGFTPDDVIKVIFVLFNPFFLFARHRHHSRQN